MEKVIGKSKRFSYEIDFVINANSFGEKCYIQSALNIDDPGKKEQEIRPFLKLRNDFTKRIVITKTKMKPWIDEYGIHHMGIYDFYLIKNFLKNRKYAFNWDEFFVTLDAFFFVQNLWRKKNFYRC